HAIPHQLSLVSLRPAAVTVQQPEFRSRSISRGERKTKQYRGPTRSKLEPRDLRAVDVAYIRHAKEQCSQTPPAEVELRRKREMRSSILLGSPSPEFRA